MYLVQHKLFSNLFDAIEYCKDNPNSNIIDNSGTVLMEHVEIPPEMEDDIEIAKIILDIQLNHKEYSEYAQYE